MKHHETPESTAGKVNPPPPIQPVSERFPALEEQEAILTILAPEVREVNVDGNFNGWRPNATPLKSMGAGKWAVRLMLRSGQYEYRFVVDVATPPVVKAWRFRNDSTGVTASQ